MIYLDSAATSFQKPPEVQAAVVRAMETCASPGRGGHREAMAAADLVYRCRETCGEFFDCPPEHVVFTFNATHGLNLAIKDLVRRGDRVVVSGFEHNAVMRPLTAIGANVTVAGKILFDPADTAAAFHRAVRRGARAVVCTHVSNVFGYVLPIEEIAETCRKAKVPLIIDASQSAGILPLSLRKLGAAYIAMPGHKGLYGPQGTGVLLCGRTPKRTLIEGGTGSLSQELRMPGFLPDRLEGGTCNVPGIAGLNAGLDFLQQTGCGRIAEEEHRLLLRAAEGLRSIPGIRTFHGEAQSGVLSFQVGGTDCEATAEYLAKRDIAVRAGLHCAPLAHRSAGTIGEGTVRISFSAFNDDRDVDFFLEAMRLLEKEKNVSEETL